MNEELTVLQVLSETKIPAQYQDDLETYPHVKEFFSHLKKGRTKQALGLYEFFMNRKEFYFTRPQVVNARTRRGNKRIREKYGSNWVVRARKYFKPVLYKKQSGLCNGCFKWFSEGMLGVDHIKRIADGGSRDDYNNMQLLCRPCHEEKDNMKPGNPVGFATGRQGTPWITRN